MKVHKEFTDDLKVSYKEKCREIIKELEHVKIALKKLYRDIKEQDLEKEVNGKEVDKEVNGKEVEKKAHDNVENPELEAGGEPVNIPTGSSIQEDTNSFPSVTESSPTTMDDVYKYFHNSYDDNEPLYSDVLPLGTQVLSPVKKNSYPLKDNGVESFHQSKPFNQSNSPFHQSNSPFNQQGVLFTNTLKGKQFDPYYTTPEELITIGPTCCNQSNIKGDQSFSYDPLLNHNHPPYPPNSSKYNPPMTQTPPVYRQSQSSPLLLPSHQSSFPLMTNQKPSNSFSNVELANLHIDGEILDSFMKCAHHNTLKGIETCGILSGTFDKGQNLFVVTHLIIPKQVSTSDTCSTLDEEELLSFQLKYDLLTLGWIHTHPTQACFLSSVDLHTHFSYQKLLKEAIAIVIAPKDNPKYVISFY